MRADRLLALLLVLQVKGKTTAAELAGELEVSVRTIYRDLEALGAAGVPVWAEGGPGGGCQLMEGYRNPLIGVTAAEAIALLTSSSPGLLAGSELGSDLASARLRLVGALPPGTRREVVAQTAKFHVDAPTWFRPVPAAPHLATLVEAVRTDHQVRLAYSGRQGPSRARTMEPWGLVAKAGRWYLVGATSGSPAVYRVDRVVSAEASAETFERPEDFDLPTFWRTWSEEFESDRHRIIARVRVGPELWAALPEIFGEAVSARMEAADPPDEAGWRLIELSFESLPAARGRLLGLGAQAEVIAPIEVREAVARAAADVAVLYGQSHH